MIEEILHSRKTRFDILDQVLKPFVSKDSKIINYIIDVRSILSLLYQPNCSEQFGSLLPGEKRLVSSELINLAAHYRHYSSTRMSKYSTFYFIYSNKECNELRRIYPNYKEPFYDKYVRTNPAYIPLCQNIKSNLKMAKTTGEYLPHIYFINTGEIEPNSFIGYINELNEENTENIVLTNDEILFQSSLLDNFNCLTVKSEKSKFIKKEDLINNLLSKTKKKTDLHPGFYIWILAMTGSKKYGIESIQDNCGPVKAISILEEQIKKGNLWNIEYKNVRDFSEKIVNVNTPNDPLFLKLFRNFELINISNLYSNLSTAQISKVFIDQIVDKVSLDDLNLINTNFYEASPLKLIELLETEDYS
jgi:hypothetical protein